jgi:hypothetical protein
MAEYQDGYVPSNQSLASGDLIDVESTNPALRDLSRPLSQRSSGDGAFEKCAPQLATKDLHPVSSKQHALRLWWIELLSIIFSLLCLTSNVCVLATLNNKQYESWHIAGVDITPNTIISIIATFGKASLLLPVAEVVVHLKWLYFQARVQRLSDLQIFDDASRGPMGSLRLLWSINRHVSIIHAGTFLESLTLI